MPAASSLPPWREPLVRALHRNRSQPFARYFQLATLRPDGRPANRTVVFRGFVDPAAARQSSQAHGHSLKLVTDRRSEKLQQMAYSAQAEVCWYFTKTREQFRLGGTLCCISAQSTLHHETWQALSGAARVQFSWPHPGQDRAPATAFQLSPETEPVSAPPPDDFAVLLFTPDWVDHLELRGNPQQRSQYQQQGDQWQMRQVNP